MSGAPPPGELSARLAASGARGVRRISIDVQGEQVTFTPRDGRVQVLCTCGAELCEHYAAALALFVAAEPVALPASARDARLRSSLRPPPVRGARAQALADALDELCLATARAGVSAHESPSIRAALEQLISAVDSPSLSLSRFIGRFQSALAIGEVGKLARLLAGAATFVAEVRRGEPSREADARLRVWGGAPEGEAPASLTDASLVEIGREWLAGLTRSAIERRYLVDLASAEIYSEERRRGELEVSVGLCPRVVHVAFAEVETATLPPRARLLQYTVSPDPSPAHWQRLSELGERIPALAARYLNAMRRCPGLAEPAFLCAPSELSAGQVGSLRDADGARLELRDDTDAGLGEAVRSLVGSDQIVWVLGRLRGLSRGFSLRPISLLVRTRTGLALRRVT